MSKNKNTRQWAGIFYQSQGEGVWIIRLLFHLQAQASSSATSAAKHPTSSTPAFITQDIALVHESRKAEIGLLNLQHLYYDL